MNEQDTSVSEQPRIEYRSPEVVVSATRVRISTRNAPSPVSVLTRKDLDFKFADDLSTALQGLPGFMVKDLGGSSGIKTISMRGMSSEQSLFLINGMRLSSFQNGLVDLGLVQLGGFERIEVVRGGQSGLYGADAIGGTVNLLTSTSRDTSFITIKGTAGSAGYDRIDANAHTKLGPLDVSAGLGNESSAGNFSYVFHNSAGSERRTRQNSDSRLVHAFFQSHLDLPDNTRALVWTQYYSAERGSPGPETGSNPLHARLIDDGLMNLLQVERSSPSWGSAAVSVNYRRSNEQYRDFESPQPVDDQYLNRSIAGLLQWDIPLTESLMITSGGELGTATLESNNVLSFARRNQQSFFAGAEFVIPTPGELIRKISWFPMFRYDDFSDVGGMWSPRIGFNAWFVEDGAVQVRSSVGKSFRAPSFNELYWRQGGNLFLTSEEATTYDAGIECSFWTGGRHRISLGYFAIDLRNRITGWPPVNIARALNRGVEAEWVWEYPGGYSVSLNSSYTDARNRGEIDYNKRVPFVPELVVNGSVAGEFGAFRPVVTVQYMSRRFTTTDNTIALSSEPFVIVQTDFSYSLAMEGISVIMRLSIDNLFNEDYEVVKSYPMPLRTYRLGAQCTFR
ncbi:MAG: TonB-dependent receptor [Bacteroidota bacterium]